MNWIKVTPKTMPPDMEPVIVSAFYSGTGKGRQNKEEVYGSLRWNEKLKAWEEGIRIDGLVEWRRWEGKEITKWIFCRQKELLKCPFCGGQAEIFVSSRDDVSYYTGEVLGRVRLNEGEMFGPIIDMRSGDPYYMVECTMCHCRKWFSSKDMDDVIKDWNKRF